MAKIVPSAVKAGTTKKWAEDYVSDLYEQVVEKVQYGGGTIPNAIKAIRGLTVKDCVADFKLSLETAKKVKEKLKPLAGHYSQTWPYRRRIQSVLRDCPQRKVILLF